MNDFFNAIADNKIEEVKENISREKRNGRSVNCPQEGITPLCVAALSNRVEMAKLLIDAGADVNKVNDNKYRIWLLHYRTIDMASGYRDYRLKTPLHTAILHGHLEMVTFLVNEAHADIHLEFGNSNTLLACAATEGHLDIVNFLLNAGVDINKHNYYNSPVVSAAEKGHLDIVRFFFSMKDRIENFDRIATTALSGATRNGHTSVVKYLINNGVAPDTTAESQYTPIMHAVEHGFVNILSLLINAGVNIHQTLYMANTPVANPFIEQRLIDEDRKQLSDNKSLLFYAVKKRKYANDNYEMCIRLLLHAGATLTLEEEKMSSHARNFILDIKVREAEARKLFISNNLMLNPANRLFGKSFCPDITRIIQSFLVGRMVTATETVADHQRMKRV